MDQKVTTKNDLLLLYIYLTVTMNIKERSPSIDFTVITNHNKDLPQYVSLLPRTTKKDLLL